MDENEDLLKLFLKSNGVAIDSRKLTKNALFFALHGDENDGNKYAQAAIEKGASFAIIDNPMYKLNEQYILVDDSLTALQQLAKKYRSTLNIPFIAITGSNGKTTTKELIACVLKAKYKIFATHGNLNNHIGVPLSILSIPKDCEIAIIEMGANHQNEIDFLCQIADPDYGLITNIGKAHLEGFGGLDGVKKGKGELYKFIIQKEGTLFVNSNQTILKDIYKDYIKVVTYGFLNSDTIKGKLIEEVNFAALLLNDKVEILSQLVGNYNIENILAACCIGNYFSITLNEIKISIESYKPSNNRSEFKEVNENFYILDAYNANPSSMEIAIENFSQFKASHKVLIIGDMLELGDFASKEHEDILTYALSLNFDQIVTVGEEFSKLNNTSTHLHFSNTIALKKWLVDKKYSNTYFLIKGSRKIGLEKIID